MYRIISIMTLGVESDITLPLCLLFLYQSVTLTLTHKRTQSP